VNRNTQHALEPISVGDFEQLKKRYEHEMLKGMSLVLFGSETQSQVYEVVKHTALFDVDNK